MIDKMVIRSFVGSEVRYLTAMTIFIATNIDTMTLISFISSETWGITATAIVTPAIIDIRIIIIFLDNPLSVVIFVCTF
jgi:uncharacterized membrane protein